jgi:hypothetical protein
LARLPGPSLSLTLATPIVFEPSPEAVVIATRFFLKRWIYSHSLDYRLILSVVQGEKSDDSRNTGR